MVYLAAQQQNKLIQFPVCANVGVLFTLDILSQACEKYIQTRFSIQQFRFWIITQPIMLSCFSAQQCFLPKTQSQGPISVTFFDRVALFSDFNYLFELLDKVLLLIAVCLLYVGIKLKKHFNNAHCQFHEQFSCRKRLFPIQSLAVERSLSESRGGLR